MDEREAIKAAQQLFGSLGSAGRSGRKSNFNQPYVTDGVGRVWFGSTFEAALMTAEKELGVGVAHKVARKAFAARGNSTEICIAEFELVAIITEALGS